MRIALISDIHGNPIALDAVLDDIESIGGADEHWVLGDIVALGHDPAGVLERLTALPNPMFIRGNTDRYVVTGERPPPSHDDATADPTTVPESPRRPVPTDSRECSTAAKPTSCSAGTPIARSIG